MKINPLKLVLLGLSFASIFFLSACRSEKAELAPNVSVPIVFEFVQGNEDFALNKKFKNALGQDYLVENMMMYLSNFSMISDTGKFSEKDSYHFVAVSRTNTKPGFELKNVPAGKYKKISFAFGVDSLRNSSKQKVGDLDANGNMGWPWTQGYKFLSFEGRHFATNNEGDQLVFHIGENANYKVITLDLPENFEVKNAMQAIVVKVRTEKMFAGKHQIDFKKTNSVMTGESAKIIAENIATMFSKD